MLPECASVCVCVWPQTFCQCASVWFSSFCNRIIRLILSLQILVFTVSHPSPLLYRVGEKVEAIPAVMRQDWGTRMLVLLKAMKVLSSHQSTDDHLNPPHPRWMFYCFILPYFRCGVNRNNDFPGSRTSHLMILSYSLGVNGLSALSKVRLRTTMSPCGTSRGINSAWEHLLFSKPTPRLTIK